MKRVCFLSMDSLDGYVSDDELAIAPMNALGWHVETVSWRNGQTDWNAFDAVVIRTTWDYQRHADEFIRVLETIEASAARLENPIEIVRWNLNKTYLRDMEMRMCPIVPTLWARTYGSDEFDEWLNELATEEIIIKPTVSATAEHTYRLKVYAPDLAEIFDEREFMVQPFMPAIVSEGEYSLFYFGGKFSHAINKAPKPDDFRVQEEHGGLITAIVPDERARIAGDNALAAIGNELLYARVDLVRDADGRFLLMELELIEPALYFRMDERSPVLFAERFDRRMNEL